MKNTREHTGYYGHVSYYRRDTRTGKLIHVQGGGSPDRKLTVKPKKDYAADSEGTNPHLKKLHSELTTKNVTNERKLHDAVLNYVKKHNKGVEAHVVGSVASDLLGALDKHGLINKYYVDNGYETEDYADAVKKEREEAQQDKHLKLPKANKTKNVTITDKEVHNVIETTNVRELFTHSEAAETASYYVNAYKKYSKGKDALSKKKANMAFGMLRSMLRAREEKPESLKRTGWYVNLDKIRLNTDPDHIIKAQESERDMSKELAEFEDLLKSHAAKRDIKPVLTGKGKGKMGKTKIVPQRPAKGVKAKPPMSKLTKSDDMSEDVEKSENICKCGNTCAKGETVCGACSMKKSACHTFVPTIYGETDKDIAKVIVGDSNIPKSLLG